MKVSQLHRKIAFDPDAVEAIANKEIRQQKVDEVIEEHTTGALDEPVDMDEINKMFANQNPSTEATGNIQTPDVAKESEEDPFEQFSQDDIDALFGK
jgi:NACalpha-BTF3-like transcription factor